MFCVCVCMSEVISSFKSLRAGSKVISLLMFFLCVILHFMSSGKNLRQYGVCKNVVGSVYVGGYGGPSEDGLYVFHALCPVSFLVVGESPSVLLLSVVMSYVNCCDDG